MNKKEKKKDKVVRHLPRTWAKIYEIKIYDPDGWRGNDQCSLNKPLDEKEWNERMMKSTIGGLVNSLKHIENFMKKNV